MKQILKIKNIFWIATLAFFLAAGVAQAAELNVESDNADISILAYYWTG